MILVAELFDGMKGLLLIFRQRLQRAVFVMNHADGRREAEFHRSLGHRQSIGSFPDPAAND